MQFVSQNMMMMMCNDLVIQCVLKSLLEASLA